MSEHADEDDGRSIAVTVIGGYLGAGKTTLVNHILRNAVEPIAVLVNDFGDVNIDADLIEQADGDTISLANGCICCSLVDGFAAALQTVVAADPSPRRLVIEASGVADPASVAAYGHGPGLTLDAVVVLVDGETVRAKARDKYVGDTVVGQLGSADIVVLNKVDLLAPETADDTRRWLADQAPAAVIVDAERADVPVSVLFGTVPSPVVPDGDVSRPGHEERQDHRHENDHLPPADALFQSWTWSGPGPVARNRIEALMAWLPEAAVRAKGVLAVVADGPDEDGQPRRMVLQRVGRRWTLRPTSDRDPPIESRCVVIGMPGAIDDADLARHLD